MNTEPDPEDSDAKRPANKATADAPAEEFIAPDSSHASPKSDRDHGDQVPPAKKPALE